MVLLWKLGVREIIAGESRQNDNPLHALADVLVTHIPGAVAGRADGCIRNSYNTSADGGQCERPITGQFVFSYRASCLSFSCVRQLIRLVQGGETETVLEGHGRPVSYEGRRC